MRLRALYKDRFERFIIQASVFAGEVVKNIYDLEKNHDDDWKIKITFV
jgi:hypothetical protein